MGELPLVLGRMKPPYSHFIWWALTTSLKCSISALQFWKWLSPSRTVQAVNLSWMIFTISPSTFLSKGEKKSQKRLGGHLATRLILWTWRVASSLSCHNFLKCSGRCEFSLWSQEAGLARDTGRCFFGMERREDVREVFVNFLCYEGHWTPWLWRSL